MNDYVLYQCKVIFIVYVDYGIFASQSDTAINQDIMETGVKFDIEYQGTLNDYIGVNIESLPDRKISISQHLLIYQIVQDVNLAQRTPP